MSVLLYAIGEGPAAEIDGVGLDGQPLRALGEDGLVAVVSEYGRRRPPEDHAVLWRYEQVVESQWRRRSALPVRFGTVFGHEDELRAAIRERSSALRAALELTRGADELGLRAGWRDGDEPAPTESGTAYMQARLAQHRRAEQLGRELRGLEALARSSTWRLRPSPGVAVVGSFLVAREQIEAFTEEVRRLDERLDEVELSLTGPWPPYTFAEEAAGAGGAASPEEAA